MVPITWLLSLALGWTVPFSARAACAIDRAASPEHARAEARPTRRADDFQKIRAAERARGEIREHARRRLGHLELERVAQMERARLKFVRRPRPPVDRSDALERADESHRRERARAMDEARACFVREQDRLAARAARGPKVPEDEEFGLDE